MLLIFLHFSSTEQVVPLLRYIQAHGNTTIYEWRRGVKPTLVERPQTEEVKEPVDKEAVRLLCEMGAAKCKSLANGKRGGENEYRL